MKQKYVRLLIASIVAAVLLSGCAGARQKPDASVPPAKEKRLPVPYTDTWAEAPAAAGKPGSM